MELNILQYYCDIMIWIMYVEFWLRHMNQGITQRGGLMPTAATAEFQSSRISGAVSDLCL